MNKSKVAAISLSTKTGKNPHISDIWMCDMVEECMMPHNGSGSCDDDYAYHPERARNFCEFVGICGTIFMQKCPISEDFDFAIQRSAPSSSIHL